MSRKKGFHKTRQKAKDHYRRMKLTHQEAHVSEVAFDRIDWHQIERVWSECYVSVWFWWSGFTYMGPRNG
ncbi:hypothetical protein Bca4012_010819 [Brassica carinata]